METPIALGNTTQTPVMRLVGGLGLRLAAGDYALHAEMFRRLPSEAGQGGVSRFLVYEHMGSSVGSACRLRFVGLEVERGSGLPPGTMAWELGVDSWRLLSPTVGNGIRAWEGGLEWAWLARTPLGPLGEFTLELPSDWGLEGPVPVTLTGHAPVDCARPQAQDDVEIVEHSPGWQREFSVMAAWLRERFGPGVIGRMAHYGSTAIPGMPAKPVIDILVEVRDPDLARRQILPVLTGPEWESWWYSDHMVVVRRSGLMGRRTHHLHLAPAGHGVWDGLLFRDYLREHPDAAARYAELKRGLALCHVHDREAYTRAKTRFVREMTALAAGA